MLNHLFEPLVLGELQLRNRIVMAPMTRNRAQPDGVPTDAMVAYYSQRADAGLIVAEGTSPSATGQAYCREPAIETPAQIAGWQRVTEAVHARGGLIVLQLMHGGRIGTHHIKPKGVETVAPSALRAAGEVFTDAAGLQPAPKFGAPAYASPCASGPYYGPYAGPGYCGGQNAYGRGYGHGGGRGRVSMSFDFEGLADGLTNGWMPWRGWWW